MPPLNAFEMLPSSVGSSSARPVPCSTSAVITASSSPSSPHSSTTSPCSSLSSSSGEPAVSSAQFAYPLYDNNILPVSSFSHGLPSEPSMLYANSLQYGALPMNTMLDSSMLLAMKQCSIGCDVSTMADAGSCSTLQSYGSSATSSSPPSSSHTPPPQAAFLFANSCDSVIAAECDYDSAEDGAELDPLHRYTDNTLTSSLYNAYQRFKQKPAHDEHKRFLQRTINDNLAAAFGHGRLFKLFTTGSSATGLATQRSDIDLCLIFFDPRTGQIDERLNQRFQAIDMLNQISDILCGQQLAFHPKVIHSNPPILKFTDCANFEVNLNINKYVTIQNTLLLQRICALDTRIRPFLFTVKLWAMKNGINCAYLKSFSSYALSLLGMFVLQHVCQIVPRNLEPIIDEVNKQSQLLIHGARGKSDLPAQWLRLAQQDSALLEVTSSVEYFLAPTQYALPSADIEQQLAIEPTTLAESYNAQNQLQMYSDWLKRSLEQVNKFCAARQLSNTFLAAGFYSSAVSPIQERVEAVRNWKERARECIKTIDDRLAALQLMNISSQPCASTPMAVPSTYLAPTTSTADMDCTDALAEDYAQSDYKHTLMAGRGDACGECVSAQQPFQSLGSLFYQFIEYYNTPGVFNSVLSVRLGEQLSRYTQRFSCSPDSAMITHICVEEPFSVTNVTHSVHNDYMFQFICKTFADTRQDMLDQQFVMDRYLL